MLQEASKFSVARHKGAEGQQRVFVHATHSDESSRLDAVRHRGEPRTHTSEGKVGDSYTTQA